MTASTRMRALFLHLFLLAVCAMTAVPVLAEAEMRTLTDKQGRSIKVEVISVENGVAKVKREDGRTFELALNQLSEADRKDLLEWAKKQASIIPAGAIDAVFGRAKFKSTKLNTEVVMRTLTSGRQEIAGSIITIGEDWGYSVTLTNRLSKPLTNVRIEYQLFVKPTAGAGNSSQGTALVRTSGQKVIAAIDARDKALFQTTTIRATKTELEGNVKWSKTGGTAPVKDTLYGIWARIYVGDQLVSEVSTPDALAAKETW
ncbi:MAG: hypothetical protein WC661_16755 [Opitutaceae bacterium]